MERYNGDDSFNDLMVLNLKNYNWTKINQLGDVPPKDFCSTIVNHQIFIYLICGDADIMLKKGTLRQFNTITHFWKTIEVTNPIPPRAGHQICIRKNKLYIFGGLNEDERQYYPQFMEFDFDKNSWTEIRLIGKKLPARTKHSICCNGEKIIIFGGLKSNKFHSQNDIQVIEFSDRDPIFENLFKCKKFEDIKFTF